MTSLRSLLGRLWPSGPSRMRRNTLTRDDLPGMAVAAGAAAVAAAFTGCHPTGNAVGDVVVTGGMAFLVAWLAATAPWWALVVAGAVAAVFGGWWLPVVLGLLATALGLWIGDRKSSVPSARCTSAALTVVAVLHLRVDPFFTASAIEAGASLLLLAGTGLLRRRRRARQRFLIGALVGLGAAVLFSVVFGIAALTARHDLEAGYRGLQDGLEQLQDGDPRTAAATLHQAAHRLATAGDALDGVWAQPVRLVPMAAQHRDVATDLVTQAAHSAEAAADALDVVDFDALTIRHGRIDLTQVALLADPLARLEAAVGDLRDTIAHADSPWLVGSLTHRLAGYRDRVDDAQHQARAIHAAAVDGPSLLGAEGPRRYLVGFASPAEARGLMGVMGNYAVLTITDGQIERTAFGRINDLRNLLGTQPLTWLDASDEFLTRYGPYGAGGRETSDGLPVDASFWSNVTMTPDMPSAAAAMAQLWEATGGDPVDGVLLLDPSALAGLLKATGPVNVAGLDQPLTAQNVERFLLLDQYALDTPERRDLLEDVADATLDALLGGDLPGPQVLARDLGPAATDGHLLLWTDRPSEESLLRLIGVDGALPSLDGRDGLAVVNDNAAANKIDSFLERSVNYAATYDAATGVVRGTVTITLTNTAPATGYPTYVIGSEFLDLPPGTNRTLLTVYSALDTMSTTVDGGPVTTRRGSELGWRTSTLKLDLAPGQTRVVVVNLEGTIGTDSYSLVLRPQPLAHPDEMTVEVDGDAHVRHAGRLTRRVVVDRHGARPVR